MKSEYVYFDHNATTPMDPLVRSEMLDFMDSNFGNASSRHSLGTVASEAVERARSQIAELVEVEKKQIIFTSGGTESNNLIIKGFGLTRPPGKIIISTIEHPCIKKPANSLSKIGWDVSSVPVGESGVVDLSCLEESLDQGGNVLSVMLANNETGVFQPIELISEMASKARVFFHTDAVQAIGKVPVSFEKLGVQAMSISAHKLNGPKGVGALIVDKKISIDPLIEGGGHEGGLRSGTLNVPAIVGFGKACELATKRIKLITNSSEFLRPLLEEKLAQMGATIFGRDEKRLPNTSYFAVPEVVGETLVMALDSAGFAVSSGAACSSSSEGPSEVLKAMNVEEDVAIGAVRVSFGPNNTEDEVQRFSMKLENIINSFRSMSAVAI